MPSVKKEKPDANSRSSVAMLDLSDQGLCRIEPLPEGLSPQTLLYNNNDISRLENLQFFAHLEQLSLASNRLVEMRGISQAQGLRVLDLSNNSIMSIEGLSHLRSLEWLNVAGNSIKKIENLSKNINLHHVDLSDNSIVSLADLSMLVKLTTLLLHGNLIPTLKHVGELLPKSIVTLSLAENELADLNEMSFLSALPALEQMSVSQNPCVMTPPTRPEFNYRPYILCYCSRLRNLDGALISSEDRAAADRLRRGGSLKTFSPGRHPQLVMYLSDTMPLKTETEQSERISGGNESVQEDRRSVSVAVEGTVAASLEDNRGSTVREDSRWSTVREDNHVRSTTAQDMTLQDVDVSESEMDEQLESESCYLPILSASPTPPRVKYDRETSQSKREAHIAESSTVTKDESPTSPEPAHINQRFLNGEIQRQYPGTNEEPDELGEADAPIMTEEEAMRLISLAATIIQAYVRGFLVRRKIHFLSYRARRQAATAIQAAWRGYRARTYDLKVISARNDIRTGRMMSHILHLTAVVQRYKEDASSDRKKIVQAIKCLWDAIERQNALTESRERQEMNKAALTLQRHWRGYRVRKMHPGSARIPNDNITALFTFCQRLQEQMKNLREEVVQLRKDKSIVNPESTSPSWSIPAIRVTRPSIGAIPEIRVTCASSYDSNEAVGEDADTIVEMEPLDLGEYENFQENTEAKEEAEVELSREESKEAGSVEVSGGTTDGKEGSGSAEQEKRNLKTEGDSQDVQVEGSEERVGSGRIEVLGRSDSHDHKDVGSSKDKTSNIDVPKPEDGNQSDTEWPDNLQELQEEDDTSGGLPVDKKGQDSQAVSDELRNSTQDDSGLLINEQNLGNQNELERKDISNAEYAHDEGNTVGTSKVVENTEYLDSSETCQPEQHTQSSTDDQEPFTGDLDHPNIETSDVTESITKSQANEKVKSDYSEDKESDRQAVEESVGQRPTTIGGDALEDPPVNSQEDSIISRHREPQASVRDTVSATTAGNTSIGQSLMRTAVSLYSSPGGNETTVKEDQTTTSLEDEKSKAIEITVESTATCQSASSPLSKGIGTEDTAEEIMSPASGNEGSVNAESPSPQGKHRTKKKILLRSTSAEALPRFHNLHSSSSMDSQELCSSLNFSNRIGHRAAAMLSELRSEIASLTARQFPDMDLEKAYQRGTEKEEGGEESSNRRTGAISEEIEEGAVNRECNSNEASFPVDSGGSSSSCEVYSSEGVSHEALQTMPPPPRSLPMTLATTKDKTKPKEDLKDVDTMEDKRSDSVNVSKQQNEVEGAVAARDSTSTPVTPEANNEVSAALTSTPKPPSFTMPVFEDIERSSFSIEDFMEDSLEDS